MFSGGREGALGTNGLIYSAKYVLQKSYAEFTLIFFAILKSFLLILAPLSPGKESFENL